MNEAETVTSVFMVTLHVSPPFPVTVVQPAVQPPNAFPAFGTAVRATEELAANAAEQVDPQLMPVGELVITPSAVPAVTFTERLCVAVPWGHPSLAGPSTVTVMKPTTTLPLLFPLVK